MRLLKLLFVVMFMLMGTTLSAQTDAFEPTPCPIELPATVTDGVQIRCGLVTVPKFHADPTGEQIKVAVAIIPSTSRNPQPDPIIMAQGGPGGSGFTYFPQVIFGYQLFLSDRDVIILEQRGTKYSQPSLVCEESFAFTREYLNVDLSREESYRLSDEVAVACAERLFAQGNINPAAFNSLENAADIPFVANALGYEAFNFYGVSYGTMLGQHLLNLNPAGLRSVILDANVPLSDNFLTRVGVHADRVFRLLFETCAQDELCNEAYPDLETKYFEVVARLDENPITLNITDPEDGTVYPALVNGDAVISLSFSAMYADILVRMMPRYISQMHEGNFKWIEQWGGEFVLRKDMAAAFYNTVMCAEDSDFEDSDFTTDIYPRFFTVFSESTLRFPTLCTTLGIPTLDSVIVDSNPTVDVPVFIASGNFDPITPPLGGEIIDQSLPNSYHFVYPNAAHGALTSSACAWGMMSAFLNNPDERPEDSCIAEIAMTFTIYVDDASGLFSLPILSGWDNISTDTYVALQDPNTGSVVYAIGVFSEDVIEGIQSAIAIIDPEFSSTPLASQEIDILGEQWTNEVYLVGQGLRLILTKSVITGGVQVVLVIDTPSQAALQEVASVLDPLIIGLETNIP